MSFKKTFLPAIVLMILCLAAAAALAFTNDLTKDRIAEVEKEKYFAAAAAVLPEGAVLEELTVEEGVLAAIGVDSAEGFVARNGEGAVIGYAIKTLAKGYGGDVACVVGFDTSGKIIGLSVSAPDETPGLGSNVQKPTFSDRFLGISQKTEVNAVEGVTSATYSSRAVKRAVSDAITVFEEITKGA